MNITVLYNQVTSTVSGEVLDLLADADSVITAQEIKEGLTSLGHKVDFLKITEDNLEKVISHPTDLFFNQAYGIGNFPQSEAAVTEILEKSGRPYTGSAKKALDFSNDKIATKYLLLKNHLPTPKFFAVDQITKIPPKKLRFPMIVKLAKEHCSLGLKGDPLVYSHRQLLARVAHLLEAYKQDVVVEEYIDGRELNVTVIGNGSNTEALPISEIIFGPYYQNHPKVVDFEAKWEAESLEYKETVGVCPADLSASVESLVKKVAIEVYKLTSCRDYARVDFRLGKNDIPYVLEVNANPGIGPSDGAIRSAKAAEMTYLEFLQKIVDFAWERA